MQPHPSIERIYQPDQVNPGIYAARTDEFIQAGLEARRKGSIRSASQDQQKIAVILVDYQYDFVEPAPFGALSVPGARDDVKRFLNWFYANAGQITTVYASLDTHLPHHIFFRNWWSNARGEQPKPFTEISAEDVLRGIWIPQREVEWSKDYVKQLEKNKKRQLMIWPYHAMEGTLGHMLVPTISEALAWHSAARDVRPHFIVKGRTMRTEYYGIFGAEIPDPHDRDSQLNTALLEALMNHDLVYVAGEAKSHCVLESERQIVQRFGNDPQILKRLHFLIDCTSSVARSPAHDYDKEAEEWLAWAEKQGVQRSLSTKPLPTT